MRHAIINSLLDTDFYKFTMGQLVWRRWRDVPVRYAFVNRTRDVKPGQFIREEDLRRELDHVRQLHFHNSELHYIRGTNEYEDRMFEEAYLEFLRNLELPPYELNYHGETFTLEFSGPWSTTIYWETLALPIINELYYLAHLEKMSRIEREVVYAAGKIRLLEKIKVLKQNPGITFCDFGTRRRFSFEWQDYVNGILAEEFSHDSFRGTSNVYLAMKYGLLPIGTSAHELFMAVHGIMQSCDRDWPIQNSQNEVLRSWWQEYGYGLSIALSDTYGTDFFYQTAPEQVAKKWKGVRQDSGDPFEEGEKVILWYQKYGIDPKEKIIVFSDGLDVGMIVKLHRHFEGRIKTTFGWGTNLTNDLGPSALSLVVKTIEANGQGLVKLSNNLAKAIGKPDDIERVKKMCGYENTYNQECRY